MYRARWIRLAFAVIGTVCFLGSSPPPSPTPPASNPAPAVIELDTIGVPGGWMGANTEKLQCAIKMDGADAAECKGDYNCLRIIYRPEDSSWVGVYWWPKACEKYKEHKDRWEAVKAGKCAIDLRKDPDSRNIERLTFSARGAKGQERVTFGVGGDDIKPEKKEKTINLESTWKSYEIDLKGVDLKKSSGLFFWTADKIANPSGFTIYLKDIRFMSAR